MNSIEDRLVRLIGDRFGLAPEELGPDVTFRELEFDSLGLVELAVIAQDEFGVPVSDDEFTSEHTLRTAAGLLADKGVRV